MGEYYPMHCGLFAICEKVYIPVSTIICVGEKPAFSPHMGNHGKDLIASIIRMPCRVAL